MVRLRDKSVIFLGFINHFVLLPCHLAANYCRRIGFENPAVLTGEKNTTNHTSHITRTQKIKPGSMFCGPNIFQKMLNHTMRPLQAIEIQIYHLHTDALSAPSLSMIADGGVNLLPWKTSMMLLPQDDFHCTAGSDKKTPRREPSPSPRKVSENKRKGSSALRNRLGSTSTGVMATSTPLEAAFFLKWCRNGRAKRRYVEFDDGLKAIVWKDHAAAKNAGVFPLSNIQDICMGIVTPVTRQAAETPPVLCRRPKSGQRLDPNLLISIIAEDRTLDLQALSLQQHQRWADGLISRFRSHMENSTEVPGQVQYRPYPQRLRSDRCELRLTCERLHSMTSFSTTVQVMQGSVAGPKLCRSCGLPLSSSGCTHCGAPPDEAMIGTASQQIVWRPFGSSNSRRMHGAGGHS